jgi:PPP family 3-phenylpropionic acid transporter
VTDIDNIHAESGPESGPESGNVPPARILSRQVSGLYASIYLHYGLFAVFMPAWLTHQGLKPGEVGLLIATPLLLRVLFVAPVTELADRLRRIRELLFACIAGTAALMVVLGVVKSFLALAVFFVVLSMVWDPLPILADAYAVASVRARGLDFGRMRVWGSLAHITATLAGGKLIDMMGIHILPMTTALLLVIPMILLPFLPKDRCFGDPAPSAKGEWMLLLKDRPLVLVVIATSLIVSSQAVFSVFAVQHWLSKGMTASYISILTGIGMVSEIVLLWFFQRLLGARSPLWMIVVSGAVLALRWVAMAFDPGPSVLPALQVLHGFGMGLVAGLMLYIAQRVPERLIATAQGVNAVVLGVIAAVAAGASGFIWQALGPGSYLVMAVMVAVGIAGVIWQLTQPHHGPPTGLEMVEAMEAAELG